MHICFSSFDYPTYNSGGGVGNQVHAVSQALIKNGHRASVVALSMEGEKHYADDNGVKVYRVKPGNLHWYCSKLPVARDFLPLSIREFELSWAAYRKIREIHLKEPIDIIEVSETGGILITLLFKNAPVITRLHGDRYTVIKYIHGGRIPIEIALCRLIQRVSMFNSTILTSPSISHKNEISMELEGKRDIVYIPNFFHNCFDTLETSGIYRDPNLILFVGRLEVGKGLLTLLNAAKHVVHKFPETIFFLAGNYHPSLSALEIDKKIDMLGIKSNVIIAGHLNKEKLTTIYQKASICVLPSYYETFGVALIEPQLFEVPVISTRVSSIPEVVDENKSGFLVEPGNSMELAEKIIELLSNPNMRINMGKHARNFVLSHFSEQAVFPKFEELYQGMLDHK